MPQSRIVPVPKVAAVIPARNERDRIAATVRAVSSVGAVDLVVVVDDGSRDGTARLAREAGAIVLTHRRSRGKAAALETGAQAVAAIDVREGRTLPRHLLFLDADLGATAAEAGALVAPVVDGKADMSIAILPAPSGAGGHGFAVRLATTGIVRATGWRPSQPLCGQRCLTRKAYAAATPLAYGFGIETGLSIDLVRKGFEVVEVPVPFRHRATGDDVRGQLRRGRQWLHVLRALLRRRLAPAREQVRDQPVFLYDGDCGFCTRSVQVVEAWIPVHARLEAWQLADLAALGTTKQRAEHEVVWIGRDGRIAGGAQGFARLLVDAGGFWAVLGWLMRVPPFRWIAHGSYRLIANNRYRLPGGTPACALPADQRPGARERPTP